jgi:hypothetical protein
VIQVTFLRIERRWARKFYEVEKWSSVAPLILGIVLASGPP